MLIERSLNFLFNWEGRLKHMKTIFVQKSAQESFLWARVAGKHILPLLRHAVGLQAHYAQHMVLRHMEGLCSADQHAGTHGKTPHQAAAGAPCSPWGSPPRKLQGVRTCPPRGWWLPAMLLPHLKPIPGLLRSPEPAELTTHFSPCSLQLWCLWYFAFLHLQPCHRRVPLPAVRHRPTLWEMRCMYPNSFC